MIKKVYSPISVFLLAALVSSLAMAFVLALPHPNLTTQIPAISLNFLLLCGLPWVPVSILQAGHRLIEKHYPEGIYMRLFSIYWVMLAVMQLVDKVLEVY